MLDGHLTRHAYIKIFIFRHLACLSIFVMTSRTKRSNILPSLVFRPINSTFKKKRIFFLNLFLKFEIFLPKIGILIPKIEEYFLKLHNLFLSLNGHALLDKVAKGGQRDLYIGTANHFSILQQGLWRTADRALVQPSPSRHILVVVLRRFYMPYAQIEASSPIHRALSFDAASFPFCGRLAKESPATTFEPKTRDMSWVIFQFP